jgi:hypothetical protein
MTPSGPSKLHSSDIFAAWFSHELNGGGSDILYKDDGALQSRILTMLEGRYKDTLLRVSGYRSRMRPDEAAMRYFQRVLERPLQLSPRVQVSVAHRLFEALCKRGADPAWSHACVRREQASAPPPVEELVPPRVAAAFAQCRQRLAELPDTLSPGSPSETIRARHGRLVLRLGSMQAAVPEEMSWWNALRCAPTWLATLPPGEPFNLFCCLMIDCMRTVHRPFGDLLALGRGLCPFDWLHVISIQQTRGLRKFLEVLREEGGSDTLEHWERAWARARVPKLESATDLWHSDIGRALREPAGRVFVSIEAAGEPVRDDDDAEGEVESPEFLGEEVFREQLELALTAKAITVEEQALLLALHRGEIKEVDEHVAQGLLERIEQWRRGIRDDDDDGQGEP